MDTKTTEDASSTPCPQDTLDTRMDTANAPPTNPNSLEQPTNSIPPSEDEAAGGKEITASPSAWSSISDHQLGHYDASDLSGDRVFPIRSVVRVDTATSTRASGDDFYPHLSETDSHGPGIPVHLLNTSRREPGADLRRSDLGPLSPTSPPPGDRLADIRRKRAMSGPYSSVQADAVRHGSMTALNLDMPSSDRDDGESGALGAAGQEQSTNTLDDRSLSTTSHTQSLADVPHISSRFTHVMTEDGHAVITGRDGTLQRCEDEPIHTPGAVQGFGVLLAIREENEGRFLVRYVSENSEKLLGYSPQQLFRMANFLDILTEEQQDNLLDHIDFIRDEDADPAVNGPEVFSLSIRPRKGKRSSKLWCAIHINPAHPDLILCEFEKDDDQEFPLRPADELTPETPNDTLQGNPTLEEIEESTEILSKPLRILRSARKKRGEQGAMQVFDIMSQVQEQLASATNLDTFLKVLIGIVKELTGFHRVMMYQFDSSFNGKVVAELVNTSMTVDLYKGLHFPASDIPRQARDLYKLNKVRLLYDRDLETARIVCRTKEDLDMPLDMTHSYLRAMSPIHLKYLANMAVRSSMSISLNAFNELWGLVACHSYGNQGMRVSFPIRKMCRLVGDTASRNIERLSYASRLQARKLINTAPTDKNPTGYIIASSDDLLRLFDADFGLLSIKGETKILGVIEQSQEALAMLEYLRMRSLTSVVASQDIREDFPDLQYDPGFQVIAGLLYVPLSVGGHDFIVFFRKGQIKEVKWAGNPYEKIMKEGTAGYLEPRTSFKTWHEMVVGKCREWVEEQIETAAVLCLVYGKFIEVWRQKEAALQSSKLTRILLANSAHEVRTPLNAIINYLEIALEGPLDQETRENIAKSHSASKSLIYVINDLLDLTKTEEGQHLVKQEIFELPACVKEAADPFYNDAQRKGIDFQVIEHPGVPRLVHGDHRRVRQAISNITANAVAHTSSGYVKVEILVSEVRDQQVIIEVVVEDTGAGMSPTQLDTLFRDFEQVSSEEPESQISPEPSEKSHEIRTLGLGLAVVARIIRNMDGQLRLKSTEGQGSRFVVQLPFHLPEETSNSQGSDANKTKEPETSKPGVAAMSSLTTTSEGEILLVDRASNTDPYLGGNKRSGGRASLESLRSGGSHASQASQKSDADRLIDAIKTPLSLNEKELEYFPSQGSTSRPHEEPGTTDVRDSKTPIRAIKVPEEFREMPEPIKKRPANLVEITSEPGQAERAMSTTSGVTNNGHNLRILIAEDDPINMKILTKRLERAEHEVHHAVNGEDCATLYRSKSHLFDAVLMDMQMPIVDGLTSTKMIRSIEKSADHMGHSALAANCGRIPIFAVSASLVEEHKDAYINAGFDAWILKPIDFKRLSTLLMGISDDEIRDSNIFISGQWERGGWFTSRGLLDVQASECTTNMEDEPTADGRKEVYDEDETPTKEEPYA